MSESLSQVLRQIPSVDRLLDNSEVLALISETSRPFVLNLLRRVLSGIRHELAAGTEKEYTESQIEKQVIERLRLEFEHWSRPCLVKVVNATGVILHTNFGRAPLSQQAQDHLRLIASDYSNLEFDLARGSRGKRDLFPNRLFQQILTCEQAIVVNNNAAALFLILNSLAEGAEVLISRGELIEIGDSFRIPDILKKSGALLREVGTTNKTKLSDYEEAINDKTRLVLRVHPSNFRVVGFTSRPSLPELVEFCERHSLPLIEDLGSGCLVNLEPFGIDDEPQPQTSLESGVDVICFSGDKLMGGPQAGIIAGKTDLIFKIRRNPLFRALRVDKLTLAALEGTLLSYLKHREAEEVPSVRMIRLSVDSIERRANALVDRISARNPNLKLKIIDGTSMIGGGSTPEKGLPTKLVSVEAAGLSSGRLERYLRSADPAVLARIENHQVLLDLRTVFTEDEDHLVEVLQKLMCQR